jgi:RNA polymerase sigma-70 factor (sigma-E family)
VEHDERRDFEDFVAQRGHALLRLACVLTGDPHLAEDLTQSALATVCRKWRRVAGAGNPEAYTRRILVNEHLSWRRRRSSTERPTPTVEPTGTLADPGERIAEQDRIRTLLRALPARARTVLVLRYYADLDDAAIADAMGVAASTVRATASRALATLRRTTEPETVEEHR